ncbi:MAG: STAS domain-containing protein [Hamadaea sp.]|uniref:STAS domain-containing protein n=1 Tax=Hamadaea sp. TaxID=2024425 RepID=UPI0017BAD51C|nr:STAS domain-containing protein [Hamadaea sp.]NUT21852.1 STAS domain-containing protein [Hamadaea sp.]
MIAFADAEPSMIRSASLSSGGLIAKGNNSMNMAGPGGPTIVTLEGDLDFASWREARDRIAEAVQTGDEVLVDMSGVPFMDSAGIAVLVHSRRQAHRSGGTLHVTNAQPQVRRVLQVMGLLDLLHA